MYLLRRGLLFLDEKQNGSGEGSDKSDDAGSGSDAGTDTKAQKTSDTKDGNSGETAKTQDKADTTSTSTTTSKDDAKAKDNSDDEKTKASAKIAAESRKIKTENTGLKDQLGTLSEVDSENKELKSELAKQKDVNIKLRLAGKYGIKPSLLDMVQGTEEQLEEWLRENIQADSAKETDSKKASDNGTADKKSESKTDDDSKTDDKDKKSSDSDKEKSFKKDIDGDRPERSILVGDSIGVGETAQEVRERLTKNL